MDNNYNHYKNNKSAYEEGTNEEYWSTYEDGVNANATHEDVSGYPPTPATNNLPENNESNKTMDNNAKDKIPGMKAAEETEILDAI